MHPVPVSAVCVQYLESTGAQRIDTGVYANAATVFAVDAQFTKADEYNPGVGNFTNPFMFGKRRKRTNFAFYVGSSAIAIDYDLTFDAERHLFVIDAPAGVVSLDGVEKAIPNNITQSGETLRLFGANGISSDCSLRVFGCTITQNGSVVRDFVPVQIGATGYLFDRASGLFYGNMGTGIFLVGLDTPTGAIPSRTMAMGATNPR